MKAKSSIVHTYYIFLIDNSFNYQTYAVAKFYQGLPSTGSIYARVHISNNTNSA